jgi:glyoxylase-like metal-dependent hydrolase (beta-lactamase superfamily II)
LFRGHRLFPEVVFRHRASRTLLVGDFAWHVTPRMNVAPRLWAGWRRGLRPTPAFRLAVRDMDAAQASLERILDWEFERVVPGHGEILETGGREALAEGYAWLRRAEGCRRCR